MTNNYTSSNNQNYAISVDFIIN